MSAPTTAAAPASPLSGSSVCVLEVGGTLLAVPVGHVVTVEQTGPVRPLPGVPTWLAGLTSVRGRVLPVVDLGALVARCRGSGPENPTGAPAQRPVGVVVRSGASRQLWWCDEVHDVLEPRLVEPAPPGIRGPLAAGVTALVSVPGPALRLEPGPLTAALAAELSAHRADPGISDPTSPSATEEHPS